MTADLPSSPDFAKATEPASDLEMRDLLVAWLGYRRHAFMRRHRDLSPDQIVRWSVPPPELFVLGLVRHMQQMEHAYLAWGPA